MMALRHDHPRRTARTWPWWFGALCMVAACVVLSAIDTRTQTELDALTAPHTRALVGRWFASPLDTSLDGSIDTATGEPVDAWSNTEAPLVRDDEADDSCARNHTIDYAFAVSGQLVFTDDCSTADGRPLHLDGAVAWAPPRSATATAEGAWSRWRQSLHALYEQLHALMGPVHRVIAVDDSLGFALVAVTGSDDVLLLSRQQRVDPAALKRFLQRLQA